MPYATGVSAKSRSAISNYQCQNYVFFSFQENIFQITQNRQISENTEELYMNKCGIRLISFKVFNGDEILPYRKSFSISIIKEKSFFIIV